MKDMKMIITIWFGIFLVLVVVSPGVQTVYAASMSDYCATPPFIGTSVTPNMLMIIDNSASMFDLAYVDKGKFTGTCSITSASCSQVLDCPTGEACTGITFIRTPYYCYDQTYSSTKTGGYAGYFDQTKYYEYDLTNHYFYESTFPDDSVCTATLKKISNPSNTLFICHTTSNVTKFVAKGNYLNWLTASKFDIQKQILTGGKYLDKVCSGSNDTNMISCSSDADCPSPQTCTIDLVPNVLEAESRGCVGRGFIKDANTADYVEGVSNTSLGITFGISGPTDPIAATAPSPGGQTYIDIYLGNYDQVTCQGAIDAILTGGNADIKKTVTDCLSSTSSSGSYCQLDPTITGCTMDSNCILQAGTCPIINDGVCNIQNNGVCGIKTAGVCTAYNSPTCSGSPKKCSNAGPNNGISCNNANQCKVSGCTAGDPTKINTVCTAASNCDLKWCTAGKVGAGCAVNADCNSSACTAPASKLGIACASNASCNSPQTCTNSAKLGQSCSSNTQCDDNRGPCVTSASAGTDPKVVFMQTMQACWSYRNGHDIGIDEVNTVHKCSDIYKVSKVCIGGTNDGLVCSTVADCPGGSSCATGPDAVLPGNPAYLCSRAYTGFCATSPDGWATTTWIANGFASSDACIEQKHREFCNLVTATPVIDPTDSPSVTANYDNLPAILSDSGVQSQLGRPIKSLKVSVSQATPPTNLIQDFSNRIRMGAMAFNSFGSATECATDSTMCAKTCSTDTTRRCSTQFDCPSPGAAVCSSAYATDLDGSRILHYIGWGYCYTNFGVNTGTRCTTDANCGATETCRSDGVGNHSSGLVSEIDNIRAATWTPFAEALYNATGYYAQTSTGKSRTDLRINTLDFNENYNPSQKSCQNNNIVLITDGMSTADRNAAVDSLAVKYAGVAGGQTSWSATCPKFDGSRNLDNIAWIAQHRRISDFSLSTASTTIPSKNNEKVTTFVVFTGASNNEPDECDSEKLLSQTATNGGTTLQVAEDPQKLKNQLTSTFESISKKAASGSAVSVLTTSSRGVGSMLQAYFLPEKIIGKNTVNWLGYTQNIWIDTKDDLREDTTNDFKLILDSANAANGDRVMRLFLDTTHGNLAGETKAAMFTTDGDGNGGSLASCMSTTTISFDQVSPIWEGGQKLANMSDTNRTIFTAIPTSVAGGESGAGMNSARGIAFTDSKAGTTGSYATLRTALNPDVDYSATDIVNYTRGLALEDPSINTSGNAAKFRSRLLQLASAPTTTVVWKLGDIINATPKVVGNLPQNTYFIDYGDSTYFEFISSDPVRRRTSAALIGANDGMLHSFRVGYLKDRTDNNGALVDPAAKALFRNSYSAADTSTSDLGKEMWAYVPYSVLPYLKYYASPDYGNCHLYYVDLSVKVYDASIGGPLNPNAGDAKDKTSWHTILLGGMRFGGACNSSVASIPAGPPLSTAGFSSYFALDITDTENPIPLWEFTDADLGYTVSAPAIIRTGGTGINGNWYVVFGSGPTQLPRQSRDIARHAKRGYLFIVNLKTGELVKKMQLANNDSANDMVGDVLVIDADKNYISEKAYWGTTYCTTYSTSADNEQICTSGWKGRIMSLEIPDQDLAGSPAWTPEIHTLFDGNYPFTASVDVAKDALGNTWVYAGSGKYYSGLDQTDSTQQIFMGFIDKGRPGVTPAPVTLRAPGTCPNTCTSTTQLCEVTNCITSGVVPTQGGTVQACLFNPDPAVNSFATTTIVTTINNASTVPQSPIGWSLYLGAREKAISRPLAVGGVVDFLTYIPSADICSHGGESYLSAVDYTTGVAPSSVAIRAVKSTTSDAAGAIAATSGTVFVQRKVHLGPGAPPSGEAIIITPPKEGQEKLKKKIQVSTGVIVETENKPTISTVSKIINWLKK